MRKALLFATTSFAVFTLVTLPALAQPRQVPGADKTIFENGIGGGISLIKNLTNWLFTILLVLAVLFIIVAAYKYLFSGGGEEVGSAHSMLIYAAVAVAVAFLARGVVYVVESLVTDGSAGSSSSSGGTGWNLNVGRNSNGGWSIGGNVGSGNNNGY